MTTTTLAIYCDLGRGTYTNQRKMLSSAGFKIFPPWSLLREEQTCVTPPVHHLPEPFSGVYFMLAKSVSVTVSLILQLLPNSSTVMDPLKLSIKFGFDGSGSHAIYHHAKSMGKESPIVTRRWHVRKRWERLPYSPSRLHLIRWCHSKFFTLSSEHSTIS